MDLVLDGSGSLQAQLARALRQAIASGRLADGLRVPPTRELADALGVSRGTVVAAYQQLQTEGRLVARVGMGTFVRAPRIRLVQSVFPATHHGPPSMRARRARAVVDPDILRAARTKGVDAPFGRGIDAPGPPPPAEWTRLLGRVASRVAPAEGGVQGLPALREAIATHLRVARGLQCTAEDVLVVNGFRHAAALAIRVLLDPGDPVAVEEPRHPGLRHLLQLEGMEVSGIPVDDQGMRVDLLEERPARLICVDPARHHPTGAVLSRARREALLDHARRREAWILEGQSDADHRRGERPLQPLQAMDRSGRVVHAGSFSRTLFPGLRLGYLVMPRGLRDDFLVAKWASGCMDPALEQAALARFIADGGYARHLRRQRAAPPGPVFGFDDLVAQDAPAALVPGDGLDEAPAALRPRAAPSSSSARWLQPGGCARPRRRIRRRVPAG